MQVAFLKSAFQERDYPPADRPEIAFAGRSNVGKSSLLNVLVQRKGIAKTSARPGRTQAINFFSVDQRLYLVDLPGYGYARVPLRVKETWRQMIETYLRKRSNLKAVVVILDIRRDASAGDMDLLKWLKHYETRAILVLTKADKLSRQKAVSRAAQIAEQLEGITSERPTVFSAKTKEGREEIWEKINRLTGGV